MVYRLLKIRIGLNGNDITSSICSGATFPYRIESSPFIAIESGIIYNGIDRLFKILNGELNMFSYRLCEEKDYSIWVEMNRAFMDEEIEDNDLWNDTNETDDTCFNKTFKGALESEELITLIIFEEDGVPVGFANLMTIYSIWAHGKALILDDLYLKPEARGKGYGKCALKYIEEYAEKKRYKRIQFQSELTNPNAMEFYKALGYIPTDMKFYVKYF